MTIKKAFLMSFQMPLAEILTAVKKPAKNTKRTSRRVVTTFSLNSLFPHFEAASKAAHESAIFIYFVPSE